MNIDRRITNGLAWAGVLLVVGIPAADLLSAQFMKSSEPGQIAVIEPQAPVPAPAGQRPAATPVEVAAVTPAKPAAVTPKPVAPAAQTSNVVDSFLQSGRPLPSYITGADAPASAPTQAATTPPVRTPIVTTPAKVDPVEVAAVAPQKVAPVPMPLSMRPVAVVVPPTVVPVQAVVMPPVGNVSADDLEDWESGPLSEFLAARERQQSQANSSYQDDGFFFDEVNGTPRRQRDRFIGPFAN